ncbi:MAG: tRNA (adenosine(37)-N6)-dimethylallyltransferase, partial [Deferrisomatales bacterium]
MPLRARPNVVILTGPTASGKSTLALAVAEAVGGEIVSADSMQVYRHLDIGTAKPSAEDRARVPHRLVDFVELGDEYHVGRFREDADRAIREVSARGRVPLVVGGTALYLKVLTQGLAPAPGRCAAVRAALDEEWERGGAGALWEELASA